MAIDFSSLKANRGNNVAALQRSLEKTEGSNYEDPRIWKYTRDEAKNISMNVIRLLPVPQIDMKYVEEGRFTEADLTPMQKVLRHNFKGPKGYLNSLSPQTVTQPDPISEWSRPQWAAIKGKDKEDPMVKAERDRLKEFIPKSEFYANILVVTDSQKPENNGQVKLFKFGEGLRKFIDTANEPKFPTDPKFDPFDPWEGANIELNLTFEKRKFNNKEVYVPKFEAVKWAAQSAIGSDEYIEELWTKQYSLLEFIDPSKIPSYDDLKAKFCKVMGFDENFNPVSPGSSIGKTAGEFLENKPASAPAAQAPAAQPASTPAAAPAPQAAPAAGGDELAELEALLNA